MSSNYTQRRRIIQGTFLMLMLSVIVRLVCFDLEAEGIRVFGYTFGFSTMFYPLFLILGLLLYVLYLSMKKGRVFCSHMCPMHLFLETVNSPKNRNSSHRPLKVWVWGAAWALFLSEVILSFFQPIHHQVSLMASGHLPTIGIALMLFTGFMVLLVGYQEKFCKKSCPYALMQMLLQSPKTRIMQFSNPEKTCTNCHACDDICPLNLRARFESKEADCSNCNLCAEACTSELGPGKRLFHLTDPKRTQEDTDAR